MKSNIVRMPQRSNTDTRVGTPDTSNCGLWSKVGALLGSHKVYQTNHRSKTANVRFVAGIAKGNYATNCVRHLMKYPSNYTTFSLTKTTMGYGLTASQPFLTILDNQMGVRRFAGVEEPAAI